MFFSLVQLSPPWIFHPISTVQICGSASGGGKMSGVPAELEWINYNENDHDEHSGVMFLSQHHLVDPCTFFFQVNVSSWFWKCCAIYGSPQSRLNSGLGLGPILICLMEEIRLTQMRLVVYPINPHLNNIPGGAGFLPSTVSVILCWLLVI